MNPPSTPIRSYVIGHRAVGDVSGEPLDPARVRSGMFIVGFLAATAPVYAGDRGFNPLLLACLAGVALSYGLAAIRDGVARDTLV